MRSMYLDDCVCRTCKFELLWTCFSFLCVLFMSQPFALAHVRMVESVWHQKLATVLRGGQDKTVNQV